MDPRIDIVREVLDRHRDRLAEVFERMPAEARDVRPDGDGWSAANLVEHLATSEQKVTGLIAGMVDSAAPRDDDDKDFDRAAFERSIAMPFILDRSRKVEGMQPSGDLGASEAWEALEASRRDLLEVLERGKGMRLEDHTHDSPVTGEPMNAYQWFAFTGLHEGRHAAQLEEIVKAVGK